MTMRIHTPPLRTLKYFGLLLPALVQADAALVTSTRAEPLGASAQLMFRIVIPQTLALSVVDEPGVQTPAVRLQVQLNNNVALRLAPASLTSIPLVRCNPGAAHRTVCTAATP
jgi:hypothetical protein